MDIPELFRPCGCFDGSLHTDTDDCQYCKGTGKLLTPLGDAFMELIDYRTAQENWVKGKEFAEYINKHTKK